MAINKALLVGGPLASAPAVKAMNVLLYKEGLDSMPEPVGATWVKVGESHVDDGESMASAARCLGAVTRLALEKAYAPAGQPKCQMDAVATVLAAVRKTFAIMFCTHFMIFTCCRYAPAAR